MVRSGGEEPTPLAEVMADLSRLRGDVDDLEHRVILFLRSRGATWEDIGDELGISRQAARARFEKARRRRG